MKKEIEKEIELQLHEQYAINNDSILNSIVVLFVGLFAAIGALGYVFINSTLFTQVRTSYSVDQVIITAIGCLVVLTIMAHICIYQGIAQRCSQFIVYAIRKKYHSQYENGETTVQDRIFPDNYKPFGKSGLGIVQGLYGEFLRIIIFVTIIIIVMVSYVSYCSMCHTCTCCKCISYTTCWFWIGAIICILYVVYVYIKNLSKYNNIQNQYKE
jgi:hypothetical protein